MMSNLFYKSLPLLMILSFLACISGARTIYVNSSTGNDTSGNGTSGSPYKSFSKAYDVAVDDDIIDLTGTFTWSDAAEYGDDLYEFTIEKNITIQGPEGDLAVIRPNANLIQGKRIFRILTGIVATIKNLELYNGFPSGDSYGGDAGAINVSGSLTILNCYIHDNKARQGCGIEVSGGNLTMVNSTVSNNVCTQVQIGLTGGGLRIYSGGNIILTNSTISHNTGVDYGGGLEVDNGTTLTITNCTIAHNSAIEGGGLTIGDVTLRIKNTIIANNTETNSSYGGADIDDWDDATIIDNGDNIIGVTNSSQISETNISNLNLSSVLAGNSTLLGTPTLALGSGSIAINQGSSTANGSVSVPTTDQRGLSRSGITDIGAYEYDGIAPVSNSAPTASDFTASPGPYQNTVYTFATSDFGYSDSDNDPFNKLLVTQVPSNGTLYIDVNNSNYYESGGDETLTNNATVSKADLDAGNLQFFTSSATNTSFTFRVYDGTDYSSSTYTATLNIATFNKPIFTAPTAAFDLASAEYSGESLAISEFSTYGITISADGSNLFVSGIFNSKIVKYNLSTPFDISTASYVQEFVPNGSSRPLDIAFNTDGSKLFCLYQGGSMQEFALSTSYDMSTASSNGTTALISGAYGMDFTSDGTKLYIADRSSKTIYQYNLTSAFNILTASNSGLSFTAGSEVASVWDIKITGDGERVFAMCAWNGIWQYNLSTPFDISTAAYAGIDKGFDPGTQEADAYGMAFNTDGNTFYIVGADKKVYQFDIKPNIDFAENGTGTVIDVDANNGDGGVADSDITYSLGSGGDNNLFSINSTSGVLTFKSAPDYENPDDSNTDNVYEIIITANDGSASNNTSDLSIKITVTDVVENIPPTASDFTASSGPYQNVVYTFATSDFGYSDSESDPLSQIQISQIPASGTLYVDTNNNDTFDSGVDVTLSNNATVLKTDLDAGNLQYFTNNATNTSFTFRVHDGTDYSTSIYTATLNVTAQPVISNITPSSGNTTGGYQVTITGTAFTGATEVTFGSVASSEVTVDSDTQITALVPEGAGSVDVTVTTPAGTSSGFTFTYNPPEIISISPGGANANGGTNVTITGNNFNDVTAVSFGSTAATGYTVNDHTEITATVPAGTGIVAVNVTAGGVASNSKDFEYYDPFVEFNVASSGGSESISSVDIQVDLSFAVTNDVTVDYVVTGSADGGGVDYTLPNGTLTIEAGKLKDTITITGIVNDLIDEANETVVVTISNPVHASLGTVTVHTYTITDDDIAPTVITSAAMNIKAYSAKLGGNITDEGTSNVTERGVLYSINDTNPIIGELDVFQEINDSGETIFSEIIDSLSLDTKYYYRAYAISAADTSYGGVVSFTTEGCNNLSVTVNLDSLPSCHGYFDGGATALITGGTPGYIYNWNNGATTASITGNNAGDYKVIVSDYYGCKDSATIEITEPAALIASAVADSNATCFGMPDGGATALASGGTGDYSYLWSNSATTASITGISAGRYEVTVTDENSCSDISEVIITQPNQLIAAAVVDSNVTCNGFADGGATASASGGNAPYYYLWSNGATTASITGVEAGFYFVWITDNNGCTDSASVTITQPAALQADIVLDSAVSCNGHWDGGATAFATGGRPYYYYQWNNGATTASITGMPAAKFTVWITDYNGCYDTAQIRIPEPPVLIASTVVDSNVVCYGESNGGATASAIGGTGNYSYLWSNGATTASITGVSAGRYEVRVTDENSCYDISEVIIAQPNQLIAAAVVDSNITCNGFADGGATASANGGSGSYSYLWSNGATTASITGVAAGNYYVWITDDHGCVDSASVTITEPFALDASIVLDSAETCRGRYNGGATAFATGGTPYYSYQWSNSATTASITGAQSGKYTVWITDQNGCYDTAQITISKLYDIRATAVIDSNATCNGGSNGGATALGLNGAEPYTYNWWNLDEQIPLTNLASVTGLKAGNYKVNVNDAIGCYDDTTIIISDADIIPPGVVTKNIVVYLDESGMANIDEDAVNNGSTDECGINSYDTNITDFDCENIGENTVILTVTDLIGNSANETAIVIVLDTIPPEVKTKNISLTLDETGQAYIAQDAVNNGSEDACGIVSIETDKVRFDCSDVGNNTVHLTVTDRNGNSSVKTAVVQVRDNSRPDIQVKNIMVQLNENGFAEIAHDAVDNGSFDICGIQSYYTNITKFDCEDIGENQVVLTLTDSNRNKSSKIAVVTVEDLLPPMVITRDIVVKLDEQGLAFINVTDIDNGSWDNCGIDSLWLENNSFNSENVGENTITLFAKDINGNLASATAALTIIDDIPPVAICNDLKIYLDATGSAQIDPRELDNGSFDNSEISFSVSKTDFDCSDIGENIITLEVADMGGNISTCTSLITVEDTLPPVAVCRDVTLFLDMDGEAALEISDINNESWDACGIDSLTVSKSEFYCGDIGLNEVTLNVTDIYGNSSSCIASVEVLDTIPPTAICNNFTAYLNENGFVSISPEDLNNDSFDNCGIDNISINKTEFTCENTGVNNVELSIIDVNGNISTCISEVNVVDTIPPVAICRNSAVRLDENGTAAISVEDIDLGSWDACGISNIKLSKYEFFAFDIGDRLVKMTVTDNNQNVSQCRAVVTVLDRTSPDLICKDTTLYLDANGSAEISAKSISGGTSDNSGDYSLTISQDAFSCENVGINIIELTANDGHGNISTCNSVVTVVDSIPPLAICNNLDVYLNENGFASINIDDIDAGSNDACGIADIKLNKNEFTCNDTGANTIKLIVTDSNNNVSECTATVSVFDTIPPVSICRDLKLYLNNNGEAYVSINDIDNGSYDECGIELTEISKNNFNCTDLGENDVILSVTDFSGNKSECTAKITVVDTIPPVVLCNDITVLLDGNGMAEVSSNDLFTDSYDNCEIATINVNENIFTCENTGINNVTLTATDASGNISICTANVFVEDTIRPVAVCNDITLYLDAEGNTELIPEDIGSGSTDNCEIKQFNIDKSIFSCDDIGPDVVTLTVEDDNGNISQCESIVSIADTLSPVFEPVSDIVIWIEENQQETTVDYPEIIVNDNCSAKLNLASGLGTDGIFPVGITTEKWIAFDDSGNQAELVFNVTIKHVLSPNINPIDDVVVEEDTPLVKVNLRGIAADPAHHIEDILVSFTDDNKSGQIQSFKVEYETGATEGLLTLEIEPNAYFSKVVTVTVVDNQGRSSSQQFTLTVTSVNDAPYLSNPINDLEIELPGSAVIPLFQSGTSVFSDIDDDTLFFEINRINNDTLPEWVTFYQDSLFARPALKDTGCFMFELSATDAGGLSIADTFNICVKGQLVHASEILSDNLNLTLYPNPTNDVVFIQLSQHKYEKLKLTVFNSSSRKVLEKTYYRGDDIIFDMSEKVSGLYFVRLDFEGSYIIRKLIVNKN